MITQWLQNRRERKQAAEDKQKSDAAQAELALLNELNKRTDDLKEALVGMQRLPHCNISCKGEYVSMYCVIEGRLVLATMGRRGGLVMSYVGEDE